MRARERSQPAASGAEARARIDDVTSRKHLLRVAREEFLEHGFGQATVANIARKSGYTTGAIYAHFANKTELLVKAMELGEKHRIKEFVTERVRVTGRRLAEFLSASVLHASNREATLLLDAAIESRNDRKLAGLLLDRIRQIDDEYREVTRAAVAEGAIDPIFDDADLSAIVTTLSMGMLVQQAIGSGIPSHDTMTRFVAVVLGLEDADAYRASLHANSEAPVRLERLVAARDRLAEQIVAAMLEAQAAGASLRAIGQITGDSHDKVRRVLNAARNEGDGAASNAIPRAPESSPGSKATRRASSSRESSA